MQPMTQLEIETRLFKAAGQQSKASMWTEIDLLRNDLRQRGIPSCLRKQTSSWLILITVIMILFEYDYLIKKFILEW